MSTNTQIYVTHITHKKLDTHLSTALSTKCMFKLGQMVHIHTLIHRYWKVIHRMIKVIHRNIELSTGYPQVVENYRNCYQKFIEIP
jgi:hypothetical protein